MDRVSPSPAGFRLTNPLCFWIFLLAAIGIGLPFAGTSPAHGQEKQENLAKPPSPAPRPYLGAMLCDIGDSEAADFQISAKTGAVVTRNAKNSPAEQAGLQAGDVIHSVNDQTIHSAVDFFRAFRNFQPEQELILGVQRGNDSLLITVKLRAATALPPALPPASEVFAPEPTQFSSADRPLAYQHPENLFQLPLPADWAIVEQSRSRLRDERFDTLLSRDGVYRVVIARHSQAQAAGLAELAQARQLLGEGWAVLDSEASGYLVGRNRWEQLAYLQPESGHLVIATGVVVGDRLVRIDWIRTTEESGRFLPLPLLKLQAAIQFSRPSGAPPVAGTAEPPGATGIPPRGTPLPPGIKELPNLLDNRPRLVGVNTESAGTPPAIELGIESPAGAAVTQVFPRTSAAAAGLRRGDLVVQLADYEIQTVEDFEAVTFSSPIDRALPLSYVRGEQRITTLLKIGAGDASRPALPEYRHTSGGYRFQYFPRWRLHPNARREQNTNRVYDYLTSTNENIRLQLYHDRVAAPDAVSSLQAFLEEASAGFLEGYSGWLLCGEVPAVFASGVVGREQLFVLYRLAFVVAGQRYEIDLFTSPLYDPAEIPFVLQTILGTLEQLR